MKWGSQLMNNKGKRADVKVLTEKDMTILPPPSDKCQICAVAHDPECPHNPGSLYYKMKFHQKNDRWPTWADAMAHCSDEMKEFWISELAKCGIQVFDENGTPVA